MKFGNGRLTLSPSDLVGFVACPHLTTLEIAVARGELERQYRHDPHAELIRRKGDEHEAAYLTSRGEGVVRIGDPREIGWEAAADQTAKAVRRQILRVLRRDIAEGRADRRLGAELRGRLPRRTAEPVPGR